jgi:MFS family permease
VLGGWLATKFGGKWVFGVGVLGTAVLTVVTPIVAKKFPLWVFILVRILEGVGEGVTFPAMHGVWARWAPPMERSKLATMSYSGAYVGTIVSMPLSGWLCASPYGWPSVFYLCGGLGVLWFVLWICLVHSDPSTHPRMSKAELEYIQGTLRNERSGKDSTAPLLNPELPVRDTPRASRSFSSIAPAQGCAVG